MHLMVFDVGGTEIKYSVMGDDLVPRAAGSVPTPMTTRDDFISTLAALYAPHRDEVEGVAVSLPGFIDSENGVVRGGGALSYNWGQPVGPLLSAACGGCKVVLENDGKAAAVAELAEGALKGCSNASVFLIGTGVGGGLVVGGKVVRGLHCTAGEFSFLNANIHNWGGPSDLVSFQCSTTGLLAAYRDNKGLPQDTPLNGKQFFADVLAGDPVAMGTLDAFARGVAIQIYNLAVLLDIEKLAVGGGISRQPILIRKINEAYDRLMAGAAFPCAGDALFRPQIVSCRFGSEANQVGAYLRYQGAAL